jgi:hypothetical protein
MKRSTISIALLSMAVFFLAFSTTAIAQGTELGSASIFTGDGYLFIHNGKDKSFTIDIKSKTIKPLKAGDNPAFDVNGKILQVVIVKNENFLAGANNAGEEKMLELHQKWESDYAIDALYHEKLNVESEKMSISDRKMLFWGFKRPSFATEFDRDYFLTTIIGSQLLGLSSPLKVGESLADYKKLFTDALSTLKVSDKPFDITKISEQLRNGTYKGN